MFSENLSSPFLSVVITVFGEEENLQLLTTELIEVLRALKKNYKIIFIDDGSTRSF